MNINTPNDPTFKKYDRRHIQCLKLAGMQPKTIEAYARAIRRIGHYFDCQIDNLKPPKTTRIPDILSVEQLQQLVCTTRQLSYKVFFFTVYALGLRLGEGIRLKIGDMDAAHMRVHIRNAKGNKDRLVPLPNKTLQTLRAFWAVHRHPEFLFPNRKRGRKHAHLVDTPLDKSGIQAAMKAVVRQMGIKKNIMPLPSTQLRNSSARVRRRSG